MPSAHLTTLVRALLYFGLGCTSVLAGCGGAAGAPGDGALRINEVVSDNQRASVDAMGEADDYIELVNADTRPIQLAGYTIEDGSGARARLPERVLAPGETLLLFADGTPEQGPGHLPFKLASSGDRLVLRATFGVEDRVEIPPLEPDQAFMRIPNATGPFVACDRPSAGRANGDRCEPP